MPTFSPSAQKIQDLLNSLGYNYSVIEHAESTRTAQEAADRAGCELGQIVKSLIFKGKTSHKPILVLTSGMQTAEQMKSVAEAGVQVVINLAPHDAQHALPNESELVNSLGMEYINIPITWRAPEPEALPHFMDTMDAHTTKKIHVHCEANYRASAFIMMYRVLRLGWQKEDARPVMEKM